MADKSTSFSEWLERAEVLKCKFCEYGECSPPALNNEHNDIATRHTTATTEVKIPDSMRALLTVSGEWHLIKGHCGVFGVNLFNEGGFLDKITIIGKWISAPDITCENAVFFLRFVPEGFLP